MEERDGMHCNGDWCWIKIVVVASKQMDSLTDWSHLSHYFRRDSRPFACGCFARWESGRGVARISRVSRIQITSSVFFEVCDFLAEYCEKMWCGRSRVATLIVLFLAR